MVAFELQDVSWFCSHGDHRCTDYPHEPVTCCSARSSWPWCWPGATRWGWRAPPPSPLVGCHVTTQRCRRSGSRACSVHHAGVVPPTVLATAVAIVALPGDTGAALNLDPQPSPFGAVILKAAVYGDCAAHRPGDVYRCESETGQQSGFSSGASRASSTVVGPWSVSMTMRANVLMFLGRLTAGHHSGVGAVVPFFAVQAPPSHEPGRCLDGGRASQAACSTDDNGRRALRRRGGFGVELFSVRVHQHGVLPAERLMYR